MIILISIIIILFIIYIYLNSNEFRSYFTNEKVCNNIDNRCYSVNTSYKNPEKASELLAKINIYCIKLMTYLRDKYIFSDEITQQRQNPHCREIVEFLLSNYNPDGIIENSPIDSNNTSYVDEKGKVFAICLREKLSGKNNFQDFNDLKFVIIHELSHMATKSYQHMKDFWTHFKFLLMEAEEANLYKPINYKYNPINYCSLHVDYNPYYDNSLKTLHNN